MNLPDHQSNSKSKQTPTATFPPINLHFLHLPPSLSPSLLKTLTLSLYLSLSLSFSLSLPKMKHFMQPKSSILRENQDPPLSSSTKHRSHNRKQKFSKENAPPPDSNSISDLSASPAGGSGKLSPAVAKLKSPLPPRPPKNSKKLNLDNVLDNGGTIGSSDSGVQVV